jgi:hypothetical protein
MLERRLFVSGLIVMAAFALAHLAGFILAAYTARHDPGMADLTRAMRAHKSSLLGFQPSILDLREYFSASFSILLLLATALGFAALATARDANATIRAVSPLYVAAMLLLLGLSIRFSVVQGIITCAIVAILFGLAWRLA